MAVVVTPDTPVDKGSAWSLGGYIKRGTIAVGIYATGGVAITRSLFNLPVSLDDIDLRVQGGYVPTWDKTNSKILVFQQSAATSALTEVPNSTDLSATAFRYTATGK